jgi:hypothetical protein
MSNSCLAIGGAAFDMRTRASCSSAALPRKGEPRIPMPYRSRRLTGAGPARPDRRSDSGRPRTLAYIVVSSVTLMQNHFGNRLVQPVYNIT